MNQDLILKVVKAVMDFNENLNKSISRASITVFSSDVHCSLNSGFDGSEFKDNHSVWARNDNDLENFIKKLNELECVK